MKIAICDDQPIHLEKIAALLDDGKAVILPRAAVAAFKTTWGKYWLEEI